MSIKKLFHKITIQKSTLSGALLNNWRKGRDCVARHNVSAPPSHSFGFQPHRHTPVCLSFGVELFFPEFEYKKAPFRVLYSTIGGKAEIRTLGGIAPSTVFKTAALNHSATFPY